MVEAAQEQIENVRSEESNIKTILQDKQDVYENKVRDFVRAGYRIINSGMFVSYAGTFWWWAVLQKDGKEKIPERLLSDIVRLRKSYEEQLQITNTSRTMGNFGYMEGRGSTLEGFIEFLKIIEETYQ